MFTIISERKVTRLKAKVRMAKDTTERILTAVPEMFPQNGIVRTHALQESHEKARKAV